nr:hypothetical protein CFP56_13226 [Quercus suber]
MQYAALALSLAASALAAPATPVPGATTTLIAPPTCERFTVAFTVDGALLSANAIRNGTNGPIVLQGQRMSISPGTPAYFNSSNPDPNSFNYKSLNFIMGTGVYGAFAADIGDAQGVAEDIFLEHNYQQFAWSANNGSISHQLYAAPNGLYACRGKLVGSAVEYDYLSFGDYNFTGTGKPPTNCVATTVHQNFNVVGGLTHY